MINENILKTINKEGFSKEETYEAYKIFFGTLASEPRLKILNLLRKGSKNVSEIFEELKMDQTSVSHSLKRLRHCGFVKIEIDGKFRNYKINEETVKPLLELIDKHMSQHCIHILKEMKKNKNEKTR